MAACGGKVMVGKINKHEKNGKKPHGEEKAAWKTMKSSNFKKLKEAGGEKKLEPKQRD